MPGFAPFVTNEVTQRIEVVGLSQAKDWLSRFSLDHDNFVS